MENEKSQPSDYLKELENEPVKELENDKNEPIAETNSEERQTPKKSRKSLVTLLIILFFIIAGTSATILFLSFGNSIKNESDSTNNSDKQPKTYVLEMRDLGIKINLPESLKGKIFSESDGENYYFWGYTEDEKPNFFVEKDSPDFFPLFTLNYSSEAFETERYSFDSGDGAYGRDDGRVIYFHMIDLNKTESSEKIEEITYKLNNEIELEPEETALVEKYKKIYEEINKLSLYFKDGFKYQDL